LTGRADDLGDNAALTPNDALGDVHATVPVKVRDLVDWHGAVTGENWKAKIYAYIPKPRLVTVDLEAIDNFIMDWLEDEELARELVMDLNKRLEREA
jgi:hypothetical protein